MIRLPNKRLVEQLASRQAGLMFADTATINYRTVATLDAYGQPATYTTTTATVACSFTDKPKPEMWTPIVDIEQLEAEIRFRGTMPSKGDTVTLSHRFGRTDADDQDYTAQTYEIIGIRDRDAFGYVCALKKVSI